MKLFRKRYGTGTLMVAVALAALLAWAAKYSRENSRPSGLWAGFLASGDVAIRRLAAQELSGLADAAEESAPALARALLEDEDPEVRAQAARSLRRLFGRGSGHTIPESLIPALILALEDRDPTVRMAATGCLGEIAPGAGSAVPLLLAMAARDEDRGARAEALAALGSVLPEADAMAPEARGVITAAMLEGEEHIRELAHHGFSTLASRVPAFAAAALADPDVRIRKVVARAIHRFSLNASPIVNALLAALQDEDAEARAIAAGALASSPFAEEDRVPADRVLTPLFGLLDDPDPRIRSAATYAVEAYRDRLTWNLNIAKGKGDLVAEDTAQQALRLIEKAAGPVPEHPPLSP